MDDEMEEAFDRDFLSLEIDLDYEFDASRFFDFSRLESLSEAREADLWFETAASYPPSPFIARINIGEDINVENVNTIPKFKDAENNDHNSDHSDVGVGLEFSILDVNYKGWALHSCMSQDAPKDEKKTMVKGLFSRCSTLMKPTVSQLAKQNRLQEVKNAGRFVHQFQKPVEWKSERSFDDQSENGCQAPKRQKLEGGHLRKVVDIKQQTDLMHKVSQKKNMPADCNSQLSRLKLTIPREPELETARRAQRLRAQRLMSNNGKQLQEGTLQATSIFKARPLNRKILEAPSLPFPQKSRPRLPEFQEFNLKTHDRAIQHSSAASASLIANNHTPNFTLQGRATGSKKLQYQAFASSRPQNDEQKREECENILPKFRARPLNKKILSSKGDIGVFRSTKREITVPVEFKCSTNKRCRENPPTELFNKLSLTSEGQQTIADQTKFPRPILVATKGSKENMIDPVQQEHMSIHVNKEGSQRPRGKQIQFESDGVISDFRSRPNMFSRSLSIR